MSKKTQETNIKEKCNKCGSQQFAVGQDDSQRRYCKCGNVWAPKSTEALLYQAAKDKIAELEGEIQELQDKNQTLEAKIHMMETGGKPLKTETPATNPQELFE